MIEDGLAERRPEGPRRVRDDVRGGAAVRRAGSASARTSRRRSSTSSRAGTDRDSRTSPATRSRCRCGSCTWRRDISLFLSAAGPDEARAVIERRAGAAYDPRLAELAARNFDDLLAGLDDDADVGAGARERAVSADLASPATGSTPRSRAFAAITGLKSPWLREHSTGVAELAEAAAWRMGLPADSVTLLRRAALAHDLGRVGVSNAIWEKPGPLGFGEWERVRLHPHFTERAFAQSPALAPIGLLAGSHHERLDGSGYHRGTRGPALDQAARILAAADCYARHARAAAVQAGARRAGGGGGAAARGRGGTARPGRRRRGARRRAATACRSDRASCPPA